jgi:hypothetical protein
MSAFFTNNFAGGMNEVLSPALLESNTAALLLNANIDSGKLSSIKLPVMVSDSPATLNHYGSSNRSLVKFYERFYWSNNDAAEAPFYGGNIENYLGIPYPDYTKNVRLEYEGSGTLSGTYKYCVTFVNPNGWESAPGSLETYERTMKPDKQNVKITVTWDDPKISYAKIYRTQNQGADFYCVGEVKKSADSFTDSTDDYILIGLEPLQTIDNYPPPDRGKYLCNSGNVFFLAVGSTLHFSVQGNPHAWPPLNFIGFDDVITGITPEFQGVLVFTRNNTYRVTGADDIATLTKSFIPGNQGCIKYNTISQVSNAPVWLSNDGICLWDGEKISLVSQRILKGTNLQPVCSVSANDCYFLFRENGAIVFDYRNGGVFSKLDFTCDYAWYDSDVDELYLQTSDGVFMYGKGEEAEYVYVSPYIGLPESAHAFVQEVVLVIDGTASVTLNDENRELFKVSIKKSGQHRLKLPYNTLCRYVQLKVEGKGTLKEAGVIYQ